MRCLDWWCFHLCYGPAARFIVGVAIAIALFVLNGSVAIRLLFAGFLSELGLATGPLATDLTVFFTLLMCFVVVYLPMRRLLSPLAGASLPFPHNRLTQWWNRRTTTDRALRYRTSKFVDDTPGFFKKLYHFWRNFVSSLDLARLSSAFYVALLAFAFGATCVWYWPSRTQTLLEYRTAFQSSLETKSFGLAERLNKRLELMGDGGSASVELAHVMLEAGEDERAMLQLQNVISRLSNSAPEAHLMLAKKFAENPATYMHADYHFGKAIFLRPNARQPIEAYFEFLLDSGRLEKAVEVLETLAEKSASYRLMATLLAQHRGKQVVHQNHAEKARKQLEEQLALDNRPETRIALSIAMVTQRDFPAALENVEKDPDWRDNDRLRDAAMIVYCVWCEELVEKEEELLSVLHQATAIDSRHPLLLSFLARQRYSGRWTNDSQIATIINETLKAVLADNSAPPECLVILGTGEAQRGNYAVAESLFRRVLTTEPDDSRVLNNIAWTIFKHKPSRAGEALEYVDRAVEAAPMSVHALTTRSEILTHMNRKREAIADLESALQHGERTPDIYKNLASLYAGIGMPQIANAYRKLVPNAD
ncbi:MAG: hypothetical protein R3C05_21435 [Pirellulaceae bacterium]